MNNFETVEDYSYNINKMYMSDCRFSLAKECFNEVKNYYKRGIYTLLNLEFDTENPFILTDYARSELIMALLSDNKIITSILSEIHVSKEEVIDKLIVSSNNMDKNDNKKLRRVI